MIKTREEFEKRIEKLRKYVPNPVPNDKPLTTMWNLAYNVAIDDILDLMADEGGCFRE